MAVLLIFLLVFVLLLYVYGVWRFKAYAATNPSVWRVEMLDKVRRETVKNYTKNGMGIKDAHDKAISNWLSTILNHGNSAMLELYRDMMQDELPKQFEMFSKQINGTNYKVEYANVKNHEEILAIIKSERALTGGISNFEKMCIDKAIDALSSFENMQHINEDVMTDNIPYVLVGIEQMGLPTTFEEVRGYLSERFNIKQAAIASQ